MEGFAPAPEKPRRRRRPQSEVKARLIDAARMIFTEVGYAAATTRDIAKRADVSETLLFRYFGSKAGLFDLVAFTPFDALAERFLALQESEPDAAARLADSEDVLRSFLSFLDDHRMLFTALAMRGVAETTDERSSLRQATMQSHYARAAAQLRRWQDAAGIRHDVSPDLAVRLGFGMVLASSLFAEWLFPEGVPEPAILAEGIDQLLVKAFSPAA